MRLSHWLGLLVLVSAVVLGAPASASADEAAPNPIEGIDVATANTTTTPILMAPAAVPFCPLQECEEEAEALGQASNVYLAAEGTMVLAVLTGNPIVIAGALIALGLAADNLAEAGIEYEECIQQV